MLFGLIGGILTVVLDGVVFPDNDISPLNTLFSLGAFLPSLAIAARRLHDIDRTGWWQLIGLPLIGLIVLIYWWVQPGRPGGNRFGEAAPTTTA